MARELDSAGRQRAGAAAGRHRPGLLRRRPARPDHARAICPPARVLEPGGRREPFAEAVRSRPACVDRRRDPDRHPAAVRVPGEGRLARRQPVHRAQGLQAGTLRRRRRRRPTSLATRRTIQDLAKHEVLLGADIAAATGLKPGDKVELLGDVLHGLGRPARDRARWTTAASSRTCTRCSALAKAGRGRQRHRDHAAAARTWPRGSSQQLGRAPARHQGRHHRPGGADAGVDQPADGPPVLAVPGRSWSAWPAASIANATFANVRERRREIGTLMAIGATPGFRQPAVPDQGRACSGCVGGLAGYVVGHRDRRHAGPQLGGRGRVARCRRSAFWPSAARWRVSAAGLAGGRRASAARLDPCVCFQEV